MKSNIQYEKIMRIKNGEEIVIHAEHVTADEYIDFLKRSDLGSQYPKEDFSARIETLVENIQISLIARNKQGQIIGICFGLTDFAYWLFFTDLGVDRVYEKMGIGKELMFTAHELVGGEHKIISFAYANNQAIPFYEKIGMRPAEDVMIKDNISWTEFVVE